MSEDTPECAKLHHLKNIFRLNEKKFLSNVFQDQETTNSLKMIPRCLNMDLRPCPRVTYALDISVQAICDSYYLFLLTIYTNFYTINVLLLNPILCIIYTNFFHSYIFTLCNCILTYTF